MQSGVTARRALFSAALFCCVFLATGCVDPTEAAKFSAIAEGMQTSLPKVTNDIAASCRRRNVIRAEMPGAEGAEAPLDCAPYDAVSHMLAQDQKVLAAYLAALGQIASNKPAAAGPALTASEATVGGLTALSTDTIAATQAAEKIGGTLALAATNAYREKKLNDLVLQNDPAVQQLCAALIKVVRQDYDFLLMEERRQVSDSYDPAIAVRKEGSERLTLLLVYRQRDNDLEQIARRKAVIPEYVETITKIGKLHAQLAADAQKRAKLSQVAEELGPSVSSLKDAVDSLRTGTK